MTVDEQRRMRLFDRLVQMIGEEATQTMFELLPAAGHEVATRADVDRIEERFEWVDERFDRIDQRFVELEERLTDRLSSMWRRDLLLVSGAQFAALAAAVLAVVTLG